MTRNQRIAVWGLVTSIIGVGIAILKLGTGSSGGSNVVNTTGPNSPPVQGNRDVNITYGNEPQQTINHDQSVVIYININGSTLPLTASVINVATHRPADVQLTSDSHNRKLTVSEVKELAVAYGLLTETPPNIHLCFLDGDIEFWAKQGLTENRYRLEFAARKAVLDAAQISGVVIKDHGTLASAAQQVMAETIKARKS